MRLERLDDQRELRPLPAEDGSAQTGPPAARRPPSRRHPVGDVGRFLLGGLEPSGHDVSDSGVRPSPQRRDDLRPQGPRRRVGHVEDRVVVAPAGPQRQDLGAATPVGELGRKPRQRRCTGSPPTVDGLVGIADCGDANATRRAVRRGAEQGPQHHQLRLRGVLELVEEHRPEPGPLRDADPGNRPGQLGRQRHLVAEVHGVPLALEIEVRPNHRQDRAPVPQRWQHLLRLHRMGPLAGEPLGHCPHGDLELVDVAPDVLRLQEVLGQLAGQ